jgi:hypothetical protein
LAVSYSLRFGYFLIVRMSGAIDGLPPGTGHYNPLICRNFETGRHGGHRRRWCTAQKSLDLLFAHP